MALINSSDNQEVVDVMNDSHAIRLLQGLLADESGAAALYSKIIDSFEGRIAQKEIVKRLKEIRNDELNHAGSLLKCISLLSPDDMVQYDKGYDGDEGGQ